MTLQRAMLVGVVAACAIVLPRVARASILYVTPESQTVAVNRTAVVDVRLNSENVVVNAVQVRVTYNPKAVDVLEVSKVGSFLKLWTAEPHIDPGAGVITFSGGVPNGSYVINGRLISLVVRPKIIGTTTVSVDVGASSVHANDGLGTATALTATPARLDAQFLGTELMISSPSHPDEDAWYQNASVQFSWPAVEGALYAYVLSDDPNAIPDTRFGVHTADVSYSNAQEGTHFFALAERLPNDGWGPVVRRRVRVDRSAPLPFTIQPTGDVVPGKLVLVFATTDAISQVVRYRVQEGDNVVENASSPYVLRDQQFRSDVRISAFDAAGNEQVATLAAQPIAGASRRAPVGLLAGGALLLVLCAGAVLAVRRAHRA